MNTRTSLLLCALSATLPAQAAAPPNILIAVADDWGLHAPNQRRKSLEKTERPA